LSDLHISKWIPERSKALRKSLGHALQFIKPALVWITGDLTDAKNKERTATRQDEGEWIDYWDSIQKVADGSGLPIERFFDMRGNHDKYGVPLSSSLDYYSAYSVNGRLNRTNLVQSITVLVSFQEFTGIIKFSTVDGCSHGMYSSQKHIETLILKCCKIMLRNQSVGNQAR
jgi:hypothetical protein